MSKTFKLKKAVKLRYKRIHTKTKSDVYMNEKGRER